VCRLIRLALGPTQPPVQWVIGVFLPEVTLQRPDFFSPQFTYSLQTNFGPGVDSAPNRNEYQKMFRGNKARPVRTYDDLTVICELTV
jgi:hypothetical protein